MFREDQQIGTYTLIRRVGRGGFGEVWLAEKRSPFVTKKVAIKLPLDEQVDFEAIRQEATLWEQASGHPNILPIIDADIYDGQVVIVSEYASGGSLFDKLKVEGKVALLASVEISVGILHGLEFLHDRRIIHRDIKPQNILLQGITPRLADFGISRAIGTSSVSLTVSGTDAYMAPEAFEGKRNIQTDIWSAGVVLYQLVSGNLPFPQKNPTERMFAILTKDFEPLDEEIPVKLKEILKKALAKNPKDRFPTAKNMAVELEKILFEMKNPTTSLNEDKEKSKPKVEIPHLSKDENDPHNEVEINRTVKTISANMSNHMGMEFAWIPPGNFMMGSEKGGFIDNFIYGDEQPIHQVNISHGFYLSKYLVTQAQWQEVMGNNPSRINGQNLPVEQVNWNQANIFINKLNKSDDGYTYRLPSEAEWEYACRAGTKGNYAGNLDSIGWYKKNSSNTTHPVGSKLPNAFGIFDMHGNVWEWCQDWYHNSYCYFGMPTDGSAWMDRNDSESTYVHVVRGGAWDSKPNQCRSAYRLRFDPDWRIFTYVGLRVVAVLRANLTKPEDI